MNTFLELLDLISELSNIQNNENVDKLDLSNEDDYQKIVKTINELKDNDLFNIFGSVFGIDNKYYDKLLNKLKDEHNRLIQEKEEKQKNCIPTVQRKVIDKSEEPKAQEELVRPSINIDTQIGLQIHKLVQEYVDIMIKPYNNSVLTNEQINDAYAGLYEFACWVYNKK